MFGAWYTRAMNGGASEAAPLFIFTGESNSGGYAPNADASAGELAARSEVQILNTTTLLFEDLNIGTNNNMDHAGLDSTTHGIELELANAVEAGRFRHSSVYVVQTGQGGSNIQDWLEGSATGFWDEFLVRVRAARALHRGVPIVFYSQGINDVVGGVGNNLYGGAGATTDLATWKTRTVAHLAKIRAELGATTLIVMTKFRSSTYSALNTAIDEIVAADSYCRTIETADSTGVEWQVDGNHWTYEGMKNLCQLFIDECLAVNGTTATPTILPVSGEYAAAQDVTITGSGTIKYTTDNNDPHIGTVYTAGFSQSAPVTIKARSIERNKKASAVASVAYTSGATWSTTDGTAGSFTLTNGNLRASSGTNAWKSIRTSTTVPSGKSYVEVESMGGGEFFMIGLAGSGFDPSSYLGTSEKSFGLAFGGAQYTSASFTAGTSATPTGVATVGKTLQIAVDMTAGKAWLGEDNTWLQSGDPAAGTNPTITFNPATIGDLYFAVSMYGAAAATGPWALQATAASQNYSPPSGFSAWG